mgnify:FL=1
MILKDFKSTIKQILLLSFIVSLYACNPLNPSIMFKTGKKYNFDTADSTASGDYRILPNDRLSIKLFANEGFKLIDLTSANPGSSGSQDFVQYRVNSDGTCELPVVGLVNLNGLTIREAEQKLEDVYEKFYVKPYAIVSIVNKRVTIFPGQYGQARVVTLTNDNVSLIEGLALAGGVSPNGKAYRVKLIRGNPKNPQIFLFDLSTVEGYKNADITLQGNDIVYVEAIPNVVRETMGEIAPVFSIISSALTLYFLITRL